jgi:signal transduction histidine kinase
MFSVKKSLFRRLLFNYLIIVLIGLGGVNLLTSFLVKGYIYERTQEELLRQAKRVNLAIQDENKIDENTKKILTFLDQSFNTRIWAFDRTGKIIATSAEEEVFIGKSVHENVVGKVLKGEKVVNNLEFEGLSETFLSVAVPWGKEDNVYGGVVLHAPVADVDSMVGNIRETSLWVTLLGVLLTTAMVSYLSWSISRPLRRIDKVATMIGIGVYDEKIQIDSEDEIGDLAKTINTVANNLRKIDQERIKLDKIRNDFLANVSHELKTPLTTMQGFLEALQEGLIREEARDKYYDVMYEETLHMNRLLEDIMDLIKIENKDVTFFKQPLDAEVILNKVMFKFKQKLEEKNIDFKVEINENLPKVYADMDRLEQILDNLVNNAVKFTEEGQIFVKAEKDDDYLLFTISDTGIGIPLPDQEFIWERFFKVDRSRSKQIKGSGLGLAIVKELVELHNGKITLESDSGKGTTFKIWIPHINK